MNEIAVSIIVPIYNAGKYIERGIRSLFEQTLDNIEYIFVDDCTPDNSIDIVHQVMTQYPHRIPQVKIIHHETNQGEAATRNTGLMYATGTYIGWMDNDDWVDQEMFDTMYKMAETSKSDIVWCDFYTCYSDEEKGWKLTRQVCDEDNIVLVRGLLCGKLHGYLWYSIAKRHLYVEHKISFAPGVNLMEDKIGSIKLRYYAQKCTYLPRAFYYYNRMNMQAITLSSENFEKNLNAGLSTMQSILSFLETNEKGIDFTKDAVLAKLAFKDYYFHSFSLQGYRVWKQVYPEVNQFYISKPTTPLKDKIIAWLIVNDYWITLRLCIILRNFIKCVYK